MKLPKVIIEIILNYHADLIHTEKMERVHAEMLMKSYIIFRPRALTSIYYWLLLD